jgi:hypothetical protein
VHAQRTEITRQGVSVRSKKTIDGPRSEKILSALKNLGYSITVLFEAAQILMILEEISARGQLTKDAHVTFDVSMSGFSSV